MPSPASDANPKREFDGTNPDDRLQLRWLARMGHQLEFWNDHDNCWEDSRLHMPRIDIDRVMGDCPYRIKETP